MSVDQPIALPSDLEGAHALILAQREALAAAESEIKTGALWIEKLRQTFAKLRHERFGQKAERGSLLDQLELQLVELEEDQAQDEAATEITAAVVSQTIAVQPFERRKPARRPLPEHLPRERVVYPMPAAW